MAELVAGEGTKLPVRPDGSIVGRHSEDGSFRPDVDLAGMEGGRSVSRQHARIFARDGQWYLRVEPTTKNVTTVAGQPLLAGQEAPIKDGDEIQLGKVIVVFRAGQEPAAVPAAPAVPILPTAELRAEDWTFPLVAPDGGELSLGRHSDDGSYRPDVDLSDLPYGRTVSRRHGRVSLRGDQWLLKVEAEVTNPTVHDGRTLALGEEVALTEGNRLQLGRVIVTFHQLKRIPNVGPEQIELIVEPAQRGVEAGSEQVATVTVINHTGHVDWFRVELEGFPASWYRIMLPDGTFESPAQVRLFHTPLHATPAADSAAQLKVVFAPPRDSQSRAGAHPLFITATTQGEPQMRRFTSGQLNIERFEGLEMTLQPEEIVKPQGEFQIDLHNAGNDGALVALELDGDGLIYQSDRQQVQINNGAWDRIRITAKAKKRHWLGSDRFYTFAIIAKAGEEEQTRRARLGCPPRIPLWMQTAYQRVHSFLLPIIILLAVLAVAFAFARPADIRDFKAEPATVVAGKAVTLSWSVDRAEGVTLEPASGAEQLGVPEGTLTITPTANVKYTLTAKNRVGIPSSRSVNVQVKAAPKILSFTASPEHIKKEGEAVTLRWETDGATKVTVQPGDEVKSPKTSDEVTVHPSPVPGKNSVVYKLIASNNDGATSEQTKNVIVDPPQITSFTASQESIIQGGEVRLRWTAQGFSKLVLKADKGEVMQGRPELELSPGATGQTVNPMQDTEYTLTAKSAGGEDSKTVSVKVGAMRVSFFRADPASITKGESTTLSWKVEGARAINITPGVGDLPLEQTFVAVKPAEDTEYTLTATGADGKQVPAKAKVDVGLGQAKVDLFTAAPAAITKGEQATLTYSVQNAKRIVIKASDGRVIREIAVSQPSVTGSVSDAPDKTTTYTLTASNDSGQITQAASVEVRQATPVPPPVPPKPGG